MAELYVARTRSAHDFEKIVALKRIFPHFLQDEDFVEMFLHEARLAARLQHPNIAQVYEIGDDDGVYFFTMEYVLGQDLRRIVRAVRARGGWFTLDQIIAIITQTAAGLHYAHEREGPRGKPLGIVHRDISPSNLLVSYDGGVKLVDFGIARAASRRQVTQAGTLKGKIPYMSPEQCRGEPLDRRSDVYSLGIILWELVLCRQLWAGAADLKLVERIATEDAPAPTAYLPNFPKDLEVIIMRALARDRDQRYSTAQELQVDLEEFARERKLALSSLSLGHFMQELFTDTIKSQKEALVEARAGKKTLFPSVEASGATAPQQVETGTTLVDFGAKSEPEIVAAPKTSRLAVAALALVFLGAAGFGSWWLLHDEEREDPAESAEVGELEGSQGVPAPEADAAQVAKPVVDADSPVEPASGAKEQAEVEPAAKKGSSRRRHRSSKSKAKSKSKASASKPKPPSKIKPTPGSTLTRDDDIKDPFG